MPRKALSDGFGDTSHVANRLDPEVVTEFSGAEKTLAEAHCEEIWIYVFPEKELLCLSPNFHILVSVSDLYISTFLAHLFTCSRIGSSFPGNICFEFLVLYLCSAAAADDQTGEARIKNIISFFGSAESSFQELTTVYRTSIWASAAANTANTAARAAGR